MHLCIAKQSNYDHLHHQLNTWFLPAATESKHARLAAHDTTPLHKSKHAPCLSKGSSSKPINAKENIHNAMQWHNNCQCMCFHIFIRTTAMQYTHFSHRTYTLQAGSTMLLCSMTSLLCRTLLLLCISWNATSGSPEHGGSLVTIQYHTYMATDTSR